MPVLNEYTYMSANGRTPIYARELVPDEAPRAVLQISHGLSEHIGRYDEFARFLCSYGFVVAGNDHLGHGRTAVEEDYGFFSEYRGWDMAVHDVRTMTERLQEKYAGLPTFLLGHSMGSFLLRTYMIRHSDAQLAGVLLSGTGQPSDSLLNTGISLANLEIKRNGAKARSRQVSQFMESMRRSDPPLEKPADWISRDPEMVDAFISDPLSRRGSTVSMLRDMMVGMRFNSRTDNLKKMNRDLPVFFFSGDRDPVGLNGQGVIRIYTRFVSAGMKDVTMKLYPEGRHEMLNEINRTEVYADVLGWLESKMRTVEIP